MIDDFIHTFFVKQNNTYPSPLNYRNFPRSVCVSVNEVICHGIPDSRPFEIGDIVNIDVTGFHRGFHADLNETYAVVPEGGDVTKACDGDTIRLLNGAKACLDEAMKACKPGVM
jgi:methionyl aminopeptidase